MRQAKAQPREQPSFSLLVGAEAFCRQALEDIRRARRRVMVQAMTFEADDAGSRVAGAVMQSRARERRVLVDDYTRWVINDRMVHAPLNRLDSSLQNEAAATRKMFQVMDEAGIGVRVTNPMGPLLLALPFRNHKKLIVADDVAYVGGVNFSDHNFAWHDLMLRIEGAGPADWLAEDFDASFEGRSRPADQGFTDLRLISLDGRSNPQGFAPIIEAIEQARREICVVSPYLTFPFVGALERAAARGARVQLITPLANNKPTVRDYLLWSAARAGFDVRLTADMMHLKGMLIDDEALVLGSSNFDFVSYAAEEELVAVVREPGLIADFRRSVIAPLAAAALPPGAHRGRALSGPRSLMLLKLADALVRTAPFGRRTARAWPR